MGALVEPPQVTAEPDLCEERAALPIEAEPKRSLCETDRGELDRFDRLCRCEVNPPDGILREDTPRFGEACARQLNQGVGALRRRLQRRRQHCRETQTQCHLYLGMKPVEATIL